ncbi:MAG: four-carbon acid sugar kinase family protein [Haloplanus sp.]
MHGGWIVADDLTGACDTGHEFAARGHWTRVIVDGRNDDSDAAVDALVVNTDSRYERPEMAATAVRTAVESRSGGVVYKKIDSTLRGNLGAEVTAALSALAATRPATTDEGDSERAPLAVVAPAYPDAGRTTACGHHLVDGALVTDAEAGLERGNGPTSSHLPTLFGGFAYPVVGVGIETVAAGASAVAERFRSVPDHPHIATVDATHERHLEAVAAAARRIERPVLYVGSAGLARHVELSPAPSSASASAPATSDRTAGDGGADRTGRRDRSEQSDATGVLGVVGSVAETTLRGLDALPDRAIVAVDPVTAVETPDLAAERAAERIRTVIDADGWAVVTAATDRSAVDDALAAGDDAGLSERTTRERIAHVLAETAADIVAGRRPRGLFLTGGDTAMTVLGALGARAIDLGGEAVETGIPLGTIQAGAADGTALITRAGAFGDSETIITCLDRLRAV